MQPFSDAAENEEGQEGQRRADVTEAAAVLDSGLAALRSAVVSGSGLLAATYGTAARDSGANRLSIWDVPGLAERQRIEPAGVLQAARFTPDETAIIYAVRPRGYYGIQLVRWPVDGPGEEEVLYSDDDVAGVAISRDSRTAVLRLRDGLMRILDSVTGNVRTLTDDWRYTRVAVSSRGGLIAGSTLDGLISLYEIYERDLPPETQAVEFVTTVRVGEYQSMDCAESVVAVASGDSVSVVHGAQIDRLYTAPEPLHRIAINAGGTVLAAAYQSGVDLVDLRSGDRVLRLGTASPVERLTFRLDDRLLVTAHDDGMARLWELPEPPPPAKRDQVEWQPDTPASVDRLKRKPLAEALAIRLRRFTAESRDEKQPRAFLIHIDGPWGTGKSTLLHLLRQELEHEGQIEPGRGQPPGPPGWLTIDFNAWQQSKVGAPWWALLAALRRNIGRGHRWPVRAWLRVQETGARFRRAGAPFVFAFFVLLVIATGFFFLLRPHKLAFASSTAIAQGASAILVALGTLWAGALVAGRFFLWDSARGARLYEQSSMNPMQDVARHFGWLIAKAGRPVVFFIDDLDRCPDSYVVELLEAVQTLIRDPAERNEKLAGAALPAFVVAADGAWIRKSYEVAYSQFGSSVSEPGMPLGYLFLDKLFQLRVPVPKIDPVRQDSYLKELLRGRRLAGEPQDNLPRPADKAAQDALIKVNRSTTEADVVAVMRQASPEVRDQLARAAVERLNEPELLAATEHRLQEFAGLLPPNPRAMKRFVNDYSVLRAVRTLEGNAVGIEPLAQWAIIETRWPALADYLRSDPEAISVFTKPGQASPKDLARVPGPLEDLLEAPGLCALVFRPDSELTSELISQCCGMTAPP